MGNCVDATSVCGEIPEHKTEIEYADEGEVIPSVIARNRSPEPIFIEKNLETEENPVPTPEAMAKVKSLPAFNYSPSAEGYTLKVLHREAKKDGYTGQYNE
jgi:hypothetical protein